MSRISPSRDGRDEELRTSKSKHLGVGACAAQSGNVKEPVVRRARLYR